MSFLSLKDLSKEEKSWVTYDIANSAFILMATAIFPIYFKVLAEQSGIQEHVSTAYWGFAISISTLIIAVIAPILGALGDYKGMKKKLFTVTVVIGVIGCVLLGFAMHWIFYLGAFIVARVGFSASIIYYDAMLVDTTEDEKMDIVSAIGFGYGYIGSCIPFILCIGLIFLTPFGMSMGVAMGLCCIITALWWFVFSLPIIKNVKQKFYLENTDNAIKESVKRPIRTFRKLIKGEHKHISYYILAYFCYIDGVYTIIAMSTSYGYEVGIAGDQLILALLLTQIIAFPAAILAGKITAKMNALKVIKMFIIVYMGVCLFAFQLNQAWEFWVLAVVVGLVQGGIQSLSRSYFAKIIPKEESNEFFGFFDIFGKCADIIGPLIMGAMGLYFGSSRYGIIALIGLFVVGYILLGKCEESEYLPEYTTTDC